MSHEIRVRDCFDKLSFVRGQQVGMVAQDMLTTFFRQFDMSAEVRTRYPDHAAGFYSVSLR